MLRLATLALLLAGCAGEAPVSELKEPADLIVYHAKIITVDLRSSIAEAIAIKDGRIVELGSDEEVLKRAGPKTQTIDADGRAVLPGLYDSHVHVVDAALSEALAPLPEFRSLKDVFDFITAKVASTRSPWSVVTRHRPPPASRSIKESPVPCIASTSARSGEFRMTLRRTNERRCVKCTGRKSAVRTRRWLMASASGWRLTDSRSINASMRLVASGSTDPPSGALTLMPLKCGGLWLAVIMTPPSSASQRTKALRAGVGDEPSANNTWQPLAASTSATTCANRSERNRVSNPTPTRAARRPRTCS